MLRSIMLAGALTACTYPEKELSLPFGCIDDPAPTTKLVTSTVSGVVDDARTHEPVSGVTITPLNELLTTIDDPVTANGSYSLDVPLARAPFKRAYFKAEGNPGYVPTFLANTHPIIGDLDLPYSLVSLPDASGIAMGTVGAAALPAGTGTFLFKVHDCNDQAVVGATVTTTPARRVFYFEDQNPSMTQTSTTSLGVVLIADLPVDGNGEVTVQVTAGEVTYRPQTYRAIPDAFTQFDITP